MSVPSSYLHPIPAATRERQLISLASTSAPRAQRLWAVPAVPSFNNTRALGFHFHAPLCWRAVLQCFKSWLRMVSSISATPKWCRRRYHEALNPKPKKGPKRSILVRFVPSAMRTITALVNTLTWKLLGFVRGFD